MADPGMPMCQETHPRLLAEGPAWSPQGPTGLKGDSPLRGHQVAFLLQHRGSLLNDKKGKLPCIVLTEECEVKLQAAAREAAPVISLKLTFHRKKH